MLEGHSSYQGEKMVKGKTIAGEQKCAATAREHRQCVGYQEQKMLRECGDCQKAKVLEGCRGCWRAKMLERHSECQKAQWLQESKNAASNIVYPRVKE